MKKRVMAILLAAMLMCNMVPQTLYAAENVSDSEEETDIGGAAENSCMVTFDMAGGLVDGVDIELYEVEKGQTIDESTVPVPVRTGYVLCGWKDETGADYSFTEPVLGTIMLTAVWRPITYRVTFDPDGSGMVIGREVNYDEEFNLERSEIPERGPLIGWTPDHGVTIYPIGTPVKNLADQDGAVVVLTGVWTIGQYQIQYDANGGTGSMTNQTFTCGTSQALKTNKFKRTGYSFDGWNTKSDGTGTRYTNSQYVALNEEDGATVVLYAMWKGYTYYVKYDGNGADSGAVAKTTHVYGTGSKLGVNTFKKKGYVAAGWSTTKSGQGKVYASGEVVTDLTSTRNKTVTLYARWQKAPTYKITYVCGGGSVPGSAKKSYTVETKTFELPTPKRSGWDFDGWYTDKAFKNRIGEIKTGTEGNLTLYAKWVKCSSKISKKAIKITSCKAVGTNKVSIQAKVKKRIASSDDYYYLVYVNPMNNKVYKMAAKTYKKSGKISYTLDTSENPGVIMGKLGIGVKKGKKYYLISNVSFVSNPEKAAENKSSYKAGKTKKGIQFTHDVSDLIDCNASQMMMNFPASEIYANAKVPYEYNGKTYYFGSLSGYQQIIKECNKREIGVTVKILLNRVEGHTNLICKSGRSNKNATYYMWNVDDNAAREEMEAIFSYLGMLFGQEDCYVSNWILGNEVNCSTSWNYAGSISQDKYFKSYAYAFRQLYYGVRSHYANAHIFICTDHNWNVYESGYSAKDTIKSFKKHLDSFQKGIKWNLAFHAYSHPLTKTDVWNVSTVTNDENTPYITMKNLNVLTNYIKKNYGSSVRIHLSELGYSSSDGEAAQAAAIAYSYYMAACNPMVDAITIRSYKDNPIEAAQGLKMGIKGKEAFLVFKNMDTAKSEQYTKKYLKTMKAASWKQIIPGYQKSRITKMYRK